MPTPEFHFDFGSPNAYLAHCVIPEIEARVGVRFVYVPVLLGGVFKLTNNASPMVVFKDIANKLAYQGIETERFIRRHGITRFRRNPFFPVNTLQIMRGAMAAQAENDLPRYIDAVFRHMWEEPKKMDEPEVIQAALESSGLDGARLMARAREPDVKQGLVRNTEASVARGTFGAPTFFVGEEIFFGKDSLRDVEDEIARTRHA